MTWIETLEINGYSFEFLASGFDGEAGIIVPPNANLSSLEYLEALKTALVFWPTANAYAMLRSMARHERPERMGREELETAVGYADAVAGQTLIAIETFVQDFANTVRGVLERKRAKAAKKESQAKGRRTSAGFVYLVQSPTGLYKIGRSVNPNDRLKTFSVKLPFEVSFACLIQTEDMYALESELHRRFAAKRVAGEWFALDADDVDYIKSLQG